MMFSSIAKPLACVAFVLVGAWSCGSNTTPRHSPADVGGEADVSGTTPEDDADPSRSCDGWEESVGPVPTDFDFQFGDDDIGHYLQLSMLARWRSHPDAHWAFVCALKQIRLYPQEAADRLYQAYLRHPHERRQDRWDLASQLDLLAVAPATPHLLAIALEPIEETNEQDGQQAVASEREIRMTAMFGLETLVKERIAPQAAREALIRIVLEHDDDGFKERAAGILKGLGMSRAEFEEVVEGTDSEWLLDNY